MVTDTTIATPGTPELNALDRCDACGAQAYVRVTMPTGQLYFCAHHAAKHKAKLEPKSTQWLDETYRLVSSN